MTCSSVTGCDVKVVTDCSSWNYRPATCDVNGGFADGIIGVSTLVHAMSTLSFA